MLSSLDTQYGIQSVSVCRIQHAADLLSAEDVLRGTSEENNPESSSDEEENKVKETR